MRRWPPRQFRNQPHQRGDFHWLSALRSFGMLWKLKKSKPAKPETMLVRNETRNSVLADAADIADSGATSEGACWVAMDCAPGKVCGSLRARLFTRGE